MKVSYKFETQELTRTARTIRRELVRLAKSGKSGHLSSCLSCVEILVSLYFSKMNENDKFILSKGHAAPLFYVILTERGIMPRGRLSSFKRIDGLEEHPLFGEGVQAPTGSLGQGISVANGLAIAKRLNKEEGMIYVLLGDGECDEGQIWEAAMSSAHHGLSNVFAIVDRNFVQSDGPSEEVKKKESLSEKFRAFGWDVIETDGHDFASILDALNHQSDRPKILIANTTRGKGVSFIESNPRYYYGSMSNEDFDAALEELD